MSFTPPGPDPWDAGINLTAYTALTVCVGFKFGGLVAAITALSIFLYLGLRKR